MKKLTPEEILKKVEEEQTEEKGKLKIFLGYCAGVGKTYHMLDIAKDMLASGRDIVIGYIEKHDRKETLALLQGMEILPTKEITYKNIKLQELNVEEVLKRKPEIVIIDEYAHTNTHGSKHEKRYQDILEILEQGIDVYTTLNIQHIESLNDIVRRITNIKVKEIIPDKYIKMADNIELIDIEPLELLNRIQKGKVYKKEQIENATKNFFTIENLTKLREIALKYMMESIDRKSLYESIKENILLILDLEEEDKQLIKKTYEFSNYLHCNWTVLWTKWNKKEQKNICDQMKLVKELGGNIKQIEVRFPTKQIKMYIEENQFSKLIINRKMTTKKLFRIYYLLQKIEKLNIYIM